MKSIKMFLMVMALTGSAAFAETADHRSGLFIEPGLPYEFGSATIDYPGPFATSDGRNYGLGFMARVGAHIQESLFLAADGRYSHPTFKDNTHNLEASGNAYNIAAVLGAQMPIVGVRVFASYVFAGGIDPGAYANGLDMKYNGASGYRIGAGMRVVMVSVNLEYQRITYDTVVEALGPFAVNTSFADSKLKNESIVLSASLPMEF